MARGVQKNRRGLFKYGKRKCISCKIIFPLTEYHFYHNYSDKSANGFAWQCKECKKEIGKKYYKDTRLKKRFNIFQKNEFTCQYCGRKSPEAILQIDHIIPKTKGGTDEEKNLITSCRDCNIGKGGVLLKK